MQASLDDLGATLFETTFVVVDLETTGLSPDTDRITEIGAVKVRTGERLGELHSLVHPGRGVPPQITAVTGITDAMLRTCPPIEALLPAWLEFLGDAVLVAHNARFDVGFLDAELRRHGYPPLTNRVVDTARLARRLLRDEVRDVRLSTLASHLRSPVRPEHRALPDARATVDVLHGLLERAGSLGVVTLEDLRDYQRSTSDPLFRKVDLVRHAPEAPGVYRFVDDRSEPLYVGKATDLRQRLRSYFGRDDRRRIADMVRLTARVEWDVTTTEVEASVREVRAIHRHRPRFNRRSRHPEKAVYVKLTAERFPRLSIVTGVRDDGATYLGPIGSRRTAQRFVDGVHDAVPIRQCTDRLRAAQDHRPCVLKELGRCGAPCDGSQSVGDYAAIAERIRAALLGDAGPVLRSLRRQMADESTRGRYEQAGRLRSRLHTVARLVADGRNVRTLVAVRELAAARARDDGDVEVVLVAHGRLVSSAVVRPDEAVERLRLLLGAGAAGAGPVTGLPARDEVEEVRLVAAWLARPGVRLLWADGELAEPVAGGGALARTVAEGRRVDRAVRRDRQELGGAKVIRRSA